MSMMIGAAFGRTYPSPTQAQTPPEKVGAASPAMMAYFLAAAEAAQMEAAEETAATGQSLEDFKKDFYVFIDSLPVHESQEKARIAITIHDKTFEKMMRDPEFLTQVQELLQREFSGDFGHAVPAWIRMSFDENGVYSGSAGSDAYMGEFESRVHGAFWTNEPEDGWPEIPVRSKESEKARKDEKDAKKRREMDAILAQLAEKRRLQAQQLQERYFNKFHASDGEWIQFGLWPCEFSCLVHLRNSLLKTGWFEQNIGRHDQ